MRELRMQRRIPDLDDFGIVVFGKNPDVDFIRPVDAAAVENKQFVLVVEFIREPDIGKRFHVIVAVAFVHGMIGIDAIPQPDVFHAQPELRLYSAAFVNAVSIDRRNDFAIIRLASCARIQWRIGSGKKLHFGRDLAVSEFDSGLSLPEFERPHIIKIEVDNLFIRQQFERILT